MNDETHPSRCATCGKSVDALRAARVRFTETEQWFFCSPEHADEFEGEGLAKQRVQTVARVPPPTSPPARPDSRAPIARPPPEQERLGGLLEAPLPYSPLASDTQALSSTAKPALSRPSPHTMSEFEAPSVIDGLATWGPVVVTFAAALFAAATEEGFYDILAASLVLALTAFWGRKLTLTWETSAAHVRKTYRDRLDIEGWRVTSTATIPVRASELRPGEEVLVEAGGYVPADGTVAQGHASVEMWEGAKQTLTLSVGDRVVAGARLLTGELHVTCSKTGAERALAPLAGPLEASIWTRVQSARIAALLTRQGALLFAAACAGLYWAQGATTVASLAVLGAVWGSLAHPVARHLPSVIAERVLLSAARRGICFSHGRLVDRAGAVTVAAFCARGTVLHGEPEVAEVHPLRDATEAEVLSLAAGAESVVHHPVAAAVLRAAGTRNIDLDACRSHNAARGMGVQCVSSSGDLIVLGSRELLLREKISIALAEDTLRSLESRGLTALMLARNSHLVGLIALQDSLRAGAKAAVQVLLDEHIEPVLVSGDSRATTEAVAHALAIDHVRPEIPAAARAREVENLIEGGATVAVIGTSPRDDTALGAAPVPIVLDGASISWRDTSHGKERAIGLCGKHVIAAPLAIAAAKRIRSLGTRAVLLTTLPAAIAAATTAASLAPLFLPPLVAGVSALLAARFSTNPRDSLWDRS